MERLGLEWEALGAAGPPDRSALEAAEARGRARGLAEGRAQGRREALREAEEAARAAVLRAHALGLAEGERRGRHQVLAQVLARRAAAAGSAGDAATPPWPHVLDFPAPGAPRGRGRGAEGCARGPAECPEARARIEAVLRNAAAPPRTVAFVCGLARWLRERGPLTPAQSAALERTHDDWGLGAA